MNEFNSKSNPLCRFSLQRHSDGVIVHMTLAELKAVLLIKDAQAGFVDALVRSQQQ